MLVLSSIPLSLWMSRSRSGHMLPGPLPGVDCPGSAVAQASPVAAAQAAGASTARRSGWLVTAQHLTNTLPTCHLDIHLENNNSCLHSYFTNPWLRIDGNSDFDFAAWLPEVCWCVMVGTRDSPRRSLGRLSSRHQPSLRVTSHQLQPGLCSFIFSSHTWILCFTCTRWHAVEISEN